MGLSLRCVARSHIGLVRAGNEDSGYAGAHLAVVADGMGGHAAGEVASQIAVEVFARLDDAPPAGSLEEILRRALDEADARVARQVAEDPDLAGMGTTVTAVLSDGERAVLAQIGDSRAYLLSQGQCRQISRDQTFVQSLIDKGRLTQAEAERHPQRNVILQAVDGQGGLEPALTPLDLAEGDRLLLCSDGLSGYVNPDELAAALAEPDAERAAEALLELALRAGGPDNITVVVADVGGGDPGPAPAYVGAAARAAASASEGPLPEPEAATGEAPEPASEGPPATDDDARASAGRSRRWLWWLGGVAAVCLVALAAVLAGRAWLAGQWYVGESDGRVAIYQGVPQQLLGVPLSQVSTQTNLTVDRLPESGQAVVAEQAPADSEQAAQATVDRLRLSALECAYGSSPPAGCP